MMFNAILFYSFFCLQLLAANAVNGTDLSNRVDTVYFSDSGYVEFTSNVPLHSFTGESDYLAGLVDFEENLIDFYLDLNTLKTGVGRRDRDMYQTLNVKEHPFAEFTGSFDTAISSPPGQRQSVTAVGEFTINGVTRKVTVDGLLVPQDDGLILEAEWTLLISDYNIEPPGILFYRVNDVQEIKIKVHLKPRSKKELSTGN